jgi:hypothetical protein
MADVSSRTFDWEYLAHRSVLSGSPTEFGHLADPIDRSEPDEVEIMPRNNPYGKPDRPPKTEQLTVFLTGSRLSSIAIYSCVWDSIAHLLWLRGRRCEPTIST